MSNSKTTFKPAIIGQHFSSACLQLDKLLESSSSDELQEIQAKFRRNLREHQKEGTLSIAFIGQYSAGKSTIISALTGKRDIHIDADIATDRTTAYGWNGIKLIDTPGLFTGRKDHDAITYEEIAQADLLVFCLTYMLFDQITVENFKRLAYQQGYQWKIMLVVNKISDESGSIEQKTESYRESITEALSPHAIEDFQTCFMDAKDYCDGVDDNKAYLVEESQFENFIKELNRSVEKKGSLAKFDTPVRIALKCIDEAQIAFARNSGHDAVYLEVLNRISRRVSKERERLRTKVKYITLEMSSAVTKEGQHLADAVGSPALESLISEVEIKLRKHYEQAEDALQKVIEQAAQSIRTEMQAEFKSDLVQSFVARLNFSGSVEQEDTQTSQWANQLTSQVDWLEKIGNGVGAQVTNCATRNVLSTAQHGCLRSMDVVGSQLHQTIYTVGKFVGFKFKPWQAVGLAKNLGNAAVFLGPVIGLASAGAEVMSLKQEEQKERKMAEARCGLTSQFTAISADLTRQIEGQLEEFEDQVYGECDRQISAARKQSEDAIASSSEEIAQLITIRSNLDKILRYIHKSAIEREVKTNS